MNSGIKAFYYVLAGQQEDTKITIEYDENDLTITLWDKGTHYYKWRSYKFECYYKRYTNCI